MANLNFYHQQRDIKYIFADLEMMPGGGKKQRMSWELMTGATSTVFLPFNCDKCHY